MSRQRTIAAILIVLIMVVMLYSWRVAWWLPSRKGAQDAPYYSERYMTGYQVFPPSSAQGYSQYCPLTGCRERMYHFQEVQEKAKYGDRRPLCFGAGPEKGIPFDVRNRYAYSGMRGEFGWRQSLYV